MLKYTVMSPCESLLLKTNWTNIHNMCKCSTGFLHNGPFNIFLLPHLFRLSGLGKELVPIYAIIFIGIFLEILCHIKFCSSSIRSCVKSPCITSFQIFLSNFSFTSCWTYFVNFLIAFFFSYFWCVFLGCLDDDMVFYKFLKNHITLHKFWWFV